jgi:ribosomal protein S18 acetylase RimI-like enzyme
MMPLTYSSPNVDDAETIAGLHVTCWREAYAGIVPDELIVSVDMADRTTRWRGYLAQSGSATFLAEAAGEAAGFIRAGQIAEPLAEGADGHIFALYILARHHRRGIGRALMGLTARAWLERGGRALSVGVLTANHGARAFYEALGARFVRPDTYQWHGHALDESIYIFENLGQLAHFA